MKKTISFFVCFVFLISLVGCSNKPTKEQTLLIDTYQEATKNSENASYFTITNVKFDKRDFIIEVSANKNEDLETLYRRGGFVTDELLGLTKYDDQWDTVTVKFGNIGAVTYIKSEIDSYEYNGHPNRFFDVELDEFKSRLK